MLEKHCNTLISIVLELAGLVSFIGFYVLIPKFFNDIFSTSIGKTHFHTELMLFALTSSFITLGSLFGRKLLQNLLEARVLSFFGIIGFSVYIWHALILKIVISFNLLENPIWGLTIFLSSTTLLSTLSFYCIEKHFLDSVKWNSRRDRLEHCVTVRIRFFKIEDLYSQLKCGRDFKLQQTFP